MPEIEYDGQCCTDCAMFIANGEPPLTDPETGEEMTGRDEELWVESFARFNEGVYWVLACNGDDEEECDSFSWSPCTTCRSPLGGSRHKVAEAGTYLAPSRRG